jgi:hypothetical protein
VNDIEIDAEFTEPESARLPSFQEILTLLDSLEDNWRDEGIDELAEAAAQMSDTIRHWRMNNGDQLVLKNKPQDQCR